MKKLFLLLCAITLSVMTFAQKPGAVEKIKPYAYCELVGEASYAGDDVSVVRIDFGKNGKFVSGTDSLMLDERGNSRTFDSMVDALNFMSGYGWEFVQAYVVGKLDETPRRHWLLRKQITAQEQKKLLMFLQ